MPQKDTLISTTLTESELSFKLYQLARREPRTAEELKLKEELLHLKQTWTPSGLSKKT